MINKQLGLKGTDTDTAELDELTYLLESGSDPMGVLDFRVHPPSMYRVPQTTSAWKT